MKKLYHKALYRSGDKFFMVFTANHENLCFLLTEKGPEKVDKMPKNSRLFRRSLLPSAELNEVFLNFDLKKFLVKDILTNLGD